MKLAFLLLFLLDFASAHASPIPKACQDFLLTLENRAFKNCSIQFNGRASDKDVLVVSSHRDGFLASGDTQDWPVFYRLTLGKFGGGVTVGIGGFNFGLKGSRANEIFGAPSKNSCGKDRIFFQKTESGYSLKGSLAIVEKERGSVLLFSTKNSTGHSFSGECVLP